VSSYAVAQPQNVSATQEKTVETVSLQRPQSNQAEPTLLNERLFDEACCTFAEPRFGYDFSRVPAHANMMRGAQPLLRTGTMVQRYSVNGNADSAPCATCVNEDSSPVSATTEPAGEAASPASEAAPTPEPEEESAATEETTAPALLVEDSAAELASGQMRKGEFLVQLRAEVTRAAESAMAGTGRTTADCPYLDYWFGYYSAQDVQHGERALRRYAPEASSATTASEYIPIVSQRVRQSVETWVRTGEVTGVPEGISAVLPGAGLLGQIGGIFFKARNGGAHKPNDPRAIQSQLGSGRSLDSGVRSRMESAFGMDFSHVRTHTDTTATGLSNRLNARAFTIGEHVAFGAGEYKPGTLFGDALIAHEMAHVVQQSGASDSVAPMQTGAIGYNNLEKDADESAVGAIASLWTGAKDGLSDIAQNAIPRLRSGLRLQRCEDCGGGKGTSSTGMSITVLKPPQKTGDCGGVLSQVRWVVPPSSPDGTIVQHLRAGYDKLENCNGTKHNSIFHPDDPFEFYEAWQVKGSKIYVGWANGTPEHRSDTFSGLIDYGKGTTGKGKATGKVAFLKGYNKTTESGWGPHKFAGSLPTRSTPPKGWGGIPKLDHWLSTEWNCCPSNDTSKWIKTKVDGVPK